METRQQIRHYCQQFRMNGIQSELDELIRDAEDRNSGYLEFTVKLLQAEVTHRERNDLSNRLRVAKLPPSCDLALYDHAVDNGLTKSRMNQLKELNWLDQVYNVILMGPSGTGYVKQMIMQSILFNLLIINYTYLSYLALCF